MDIGSAFTFVFDDQDWIKKLAIGGGILLLAFVLSPILIGLALFLPVSGYMIQVLKNVRDNNPRPLPEWTDFGDLFKKGLSVFAIALVFMLPGIILSCGANGLTIAGDSMDQDAAGALAIVAVCLSCLQILVSLGGQFLLPAAYIRYAQTDSIGSAFQFGEIFNFIRTNIGDYFIVFLLTLVASIVAGLGLILCVIGVVFTTFWSFMVTAHLYGQLARKARPIY